MFCYTRYREKGHSMGALESLQSVQFVTMNHKRFAVLDAEDWEALVDWLEDLEDRQIVGQAMDELRAVGGDRARANWRLWQTAAGELE
jgi:hypothetical protein